jgi:NDP-sugar pyrophosphorylase family protein
MIFPDLFVFAGGSSHLRRRRNFRKMHDMSGTNAVVLVGGMGTRLRPVVGDRPKGLAPVRGRPFLCFLLDQLATAGIRKVVLCTGYLGEQVSAAFGNSYSGIDLVYSQENRPLDTAGALRLAAPFVESDEALVMNGDSFCEADLKAFCGWYSSRDIKAALLINRISDASRYGQVEADDNGMVISFKEKSENAGPGWINAGIYLLDRRLILEIRQSSPVSLEREVLPAFIAQRRLYSYKNHGQFLDIGTPEAYAAAWDYFLAMERRG